MTAMVDAGPLVEAGATNSPLAHTIRASFARERGDLIIPAPITTEVDYLLQQRGSPDATRRFMRDIADGQFSVECLVAAEYELLVMLADRYAAFQPGLADLSVVILAHRFGTNRVFTLDQRHFRAMTTLDGRPFLLLPWDEP